MLATAEWGAADYLLMSMAVMATAVMFVLTVLIVDESSAKAGSDSTRNEIEKDAIANGVARYVCDPETGDVEFQWISQPNEIEVQR